MKDAYHLAVEFKKRYPKTLAWRLKKNAEIIEKHLNPKEEIKYIFVAQKNDNPLNFLATAVIALTSERLLIGRNRVVIGYWLDSITPDLFNDLKVQAGFLWGKIYIDTMKELVKLSNIDKKALPEIETKITTYMMEEKKKYAKKDL